MGYDTRYYGKLLFTRRLNSHELAWINEIIDARELDPLDEKLTLAELGFIMPKGPPGRIDYVLTDNRDGIEFSHAEKSYGMVEGANFIIANARRKIPNFGLKGQITAETEFPPYNWHIGIDKDGWAYQFPKVFGPAPYDWAMLIEEIFRDKQLTGSNEGYKIWLAEEAVERILQQGRQEALQQDPGAERPKRFQRVRNLFRLNR